VVNFSVVFPFRVVIVNLAFIASDVSPTTLAFSFEIIAVREFSFCTFYNVEPTIFDLITSTAKRSNGPFVELINLTAVRNLCKFNFWPLHSGYAFNMSFVYARWAMVSSVIMVGLCSLG